MTFYKDLEFGSTYEDLAMEYYKTDSNYIIKAPFKKFKEYDFTIKRKDENNIIKIKHIEVKADKMAFKSGNIVIEHRCNNIDSGISTTKAIIWVYFIIKGNDYDMYTIPTSFIRSMINKNRWTRKVRGGDNRASEMFIFNLSVFNKYKVQKSKVI